MGSAKGQYECVSEFIRQDYTEDLKKITVPVLAMNGDGDQVVPHDSSGPRAVKLVQNGTLKTYLASRMGCRPRTPTRSTRLAGVYPVLIVLIRVSASVPAGRLAVCRLRRAFPPNVPCLLLLASLPPAVALLEPPESLRLAAEKGPKAEPRHP